MRCVIFQHAAAVRIASDNYDAYCHFQSVLSCRVCEKFSVIALNRTSKAGVALEQLVARHSNILYRSRRHCNFHSNFKGECVCTEFLIVFEMMQLSYRTFI